MLTKTNLILMNLLFKKNQHLLKENQLNVNKTLLRIANKLEINCKNLFDLFCKRRIITELN